MIRAAAALAILLLAVPTLAQEDGPEPGDKIAVLAIPTDEALRLDEELSGIIARAVKRELARRGFESVVLPRSVEELEADGLTDVVDADWILEISYSDGRRGSFGAFGGSGDAGRVDVGAEISIERSELEADVRFYDGATLEMLDDWTLGSRSTMPVLSGIGLGGRHGGLWIGLPRFNPFARAAGAIARQAVARIISGEAASER